MIYLIVGIGLFVAAWIFLAVGPLGDWMDRDIAQKRYELNRIKCEYCGCKNGTWPRECDFCGAPLHMNPVQYF